MVEPTSGIFAEPTKSGEIESPTDLSIPGRLFYPGKSMTRQAMVEELSKFGATFVQGAEAVCNLYLRITDHIRTYKMDPEEVASALRAAGFSEPRISEVKRVAYAPDEIYLAFATGEDGFRVALSKTRRHQMDTRTKTKWRNRQLRRMAGRMIHFAKAEPIGPEGWEYAMKVLKIRIVSA